MSAQAAEAGPGASPVAPTYLTQEAHDRLTQELADRSGPVRESIRLRIAAAREEGDLRENGGYHAAREEQGKNEARIRQLTTMLASAVIGVPEVDAGTVAVGQVVTVRFADGEEERFLLASREEAAHAAIDVYSPSSPLGAAVTGARVGAEVTYDLPTGRQVTVTVTAVEPHLG